MHHGNESKVGLPPPLHLKKKGTMIIRKILYTKKKSSLDRRKKSWKEVRTKEAQNWEKMYKILQKCTKLDENVQI
jgi:hypothetical protein